MRHLRQWAGFFLQSVTVGLAAAFIVVLVRPDLLPQREGGPDQPAAGAHGVGYADAVELAAPAVVNVHAATRVNRGGLLADPFFRQFFGNLLPAPQSRIQTSLGSGVILAGDQRFILTYNHVIAGADQIRIALSDGRVAEAEVVGADPETDIALLRTDLTELPGMPIGRSDELRVGEVVLAIGNPFGFGQTVTQGIVSATGRSQLGLTTFENFIQTDAAINPGNSGGALINVRGELVGINTAIYSRSGESNGIGFAIPVNLARGVMDQLIAHGRVIRGWLGIDPQDLTPALAASLELDTTQGVAVAAVHRNGPSNLAGLRAGDVITHIDGEPIADRLQALRIITARAPGETMTLGLIRAGQALEADVVVGERPVDR